MSASTVRTLKLGDVANFICALVQKSRHLYPFFFSASSDARQVEIRWGDQEGKTLVFQRNPDSSFRYILMEEDGKEVTKSAAQEEMEEIGAFPFGAEFYRLIGERIANPFISIDMFIHAISAFTQKGLTVEVVY